MTHDHSYTTQEQIYALKAADRADKAAAKAEMIAAVGNMAGAALGGLLEGLKQSEATTLLARRRSALELAARAHVDAVQGRYLVRPIRLRLGDGLLVVDSHNGSWIELPVAPFEGSVGKDVFLDAQPAMIVDGRLVTKGIDLDPARWEPYELSVGITTVHRSLLAFDVSGLPMRPAAKYATESKGRASVDKTY